MAPTNKVAFTLRRAHIGGAQFSIGRAGGRAFLFWACFSRRCSPTAVANFISLNPLQKTPEILIF
jgi:hypothetical protein